MTPHSPSLLLTPERIDRIASDLDAGREPVRSAWTEVLRIADAGLDRIPEVPTRWFVPWYYVQPEEHNLRKNGLRDDANTAYAQALAARLTGERRYADAAVRLLNAWATGLEDLSLEEDSTLSFSNLFPAFVFTADLLRDHPAWKAADRERFHQFLRDRALPMNCMEKENNWGNWGLLLVTACAAYLEDRELLNTCGERWRFFLDTQQAEDGHLPREVTRNEGRHGVWYSHFALMPQTVAAEILRMNGTDLFDYVSPTGGTLRKACERLIPWIRDPGSFPWWEGAPEDLVRPGYFSYFEILRRRWPDFPADDLLRAARPMSAEHSAPYLTLTHGVAL